MNETLHQNYDGRPEQVLGIVKPGPREPLRDLVHPDAGVHRHGGGGGAHDACHVPDLGPELIIVSNAPVVEVLVSPQALVVLFIDDIP